MFSNVFKGRKVLVTGHTGFKGSWLVAWLKVLGADVIGFSKDIPTQPSHFELANMSQQITDVRGDVTKYNEIQLCIEKYQPEILFHFAANAIVSDCLENPQEAFMVNAIGSINVLEAIRHNKSLKSVVMITSDKCYENVEWEFGYRENDRLGGKDPYSASKACAEIAFSSYFRTYLKTHAQLKIATARAGNVIGGGDWAKSRIVPDCIRSWSTNEEAPIRNPRSTRPWQHVLEPISGYLALAAKLLEPDCNINGESFNFGPKAEVNKTVLELITEMKKYWSNVNWRILDTHYLNQKEASLLKLSCDKALSHLGWNAALNFEETVQMTTDWYKNWHGKKQGIEEYTRNQILHYQDVSQQRGLSWTKK